MESNSAALGTALVEAISQTAQHIQSEFGRLEPIGFALCTDDDVMTLFDVHLTTQGASQLGDSAGNIRFEYWDWNESSGNPIFDYASDALRQWANADNSVSGKEGRFSVLVDAMAACRSNGVFGDQTFLCVASTDPDTHSQWLGVTAVKRLNNEDLAARFFEYIGWNG